MKLRNNISRNKTVLTPTNASIEQDTSGTTNVENQHLPDHQLWRSHNLPPRPDARGFHSASSDMATKRKHALLANPIIPLIVCVKSESSLERYRLPNRKENSTDRTMECQKTPFARMKSEFSLEYPNASILYRRPKTN